MKYILKETFNECLEQNGTMDQYYKELEYIAEELLIGTDELGITEVVDLQKIKRYFMVKVLFRKALIFGGFHRMRIKLEEIVELTLDEFVDKYVESNPECIDAYNELVSALL